MEKQRCGATVRSVGGSWRGHPCGKPAKVQDPSGPHCGIHSDEAVAKRAQKRDDKWAQERSARVRAVVRKQVERDALHEILEAVSDPDVFITEDMRNNAVVLRRGYGQLAGKE